MECFPLIHWRLSLFPPCSPTRGSGVNYPILAASWLLTDSSLELSSLLTQTFTLWGAEPLSESNMQMSLRSRAINWYLDMLERLLISLEQSSSMTFYLDFGFICKPIVAASGVPAYPFPGGSWIVLTECSQSISYIICGDTYSFSVAAFWYWCEHHIHLYTMPHPQVLDAILVQYTLVWWLFSCCCTMCKYHQHGLGLRKFLLEWVPSQILYPYQHQQDSLTGKPRFFYSSWQP